MYKLKTCSAFDGAHFLYGYDGKCRNIHGHRWNVEAVICGDDLDTETQTRGMLVDFSTFKRDLKLITEEYDHSLIIERDSLKSETLAALAAEDIKMNVLDVRPTAENLARLFYEKLCDMGYHVYEMTVYETPENCATYSKRSEK